MAKRLRDVCGLPESEPLWQIQTVNRIIGCVVAQVLSSGERI
jgi:hypothetical protein